MAHNPDPTVTLRRDPVAPADDMAGTVAHEALLSFRQAGFDVDSVQLVATRKGARVASWVVIARAEGG